MSSSTLGKVLLEYRSLGIINYTADYNIPSIHLILGEGPRICYWSLVYKKITCWPLPGLVCQSQPPATSGWMFTAGVLEAANREEMNEDRRTGSLPV